MGHDGVNESETSVIIRIKDVNDLPPAFLDQTYNSTIFEETIHTRQPILQVGQAQAPCSHQMWKLSAATSRSASSTNIYIKLNWRPAQHSGEFNLIFPLKLLIYLTFLIVLVFLEILFSTISIFWLDCLRIWRKIKSWVLNKSKQWNFTMADFIQIRPDFYFKWKICSYVSLKCLLSATTNWAKCT